ncbi:DUF6044 family protein [Acinetobacter sp. SWBY1]|uniref:DUF6044 family protein n=1 Tax=Acinetobacter sp. SWBY1 TaxID=2079596 RepID=UPI000CF20BB8|nr:DUF6044 family protein [Acinetobacter sp. SWBY1]AVH49923.1 hypothetical protein C3Y93_10100 [Acinetobacter sp. SWBY1]
MKYKLELYFYFFSVFILILFFSLNYSNLFIEIHDNLDQHFGWYKLLSDNNAWFSKNNYLLPYMGETERGILLPETQLVNFIFIYLDPLLAHCVLIVTKFTIGFFSFLILANYLFSNKNIPTIYVCLIAISFALMPGNENLYIAQASVPLILYLYLKYINKQSIVFLILILAYPILSELTRFGMFILVYMGFHFIYLIYKKDSRYKYSFLSLIFLSLGYLLVEYRLIFSMVLSSEDTIRKTMILLKEGNLLKVFIKSIVSGQYHFSNLTFVFIPFTLYLIFIKIKQDIKLPTPIYLLFGLIIVNCFIYAVYTTTDVKYLVWEYVSPLSGWNFSRFIWFNSFFWCLATLSLISYLHKSSNKFIILFFLFAQLVLTIVYPTYGNDFYRTIKCNYLSKCENQFSYNEFYSINLFDKIKNTIKYNKDERVIAFGFHPSVLTYNGFYTMDGYHNAYYQKYKNEFRGLIKPGLDQSEKYKAYFDNWGGRAYIFSKDSDYKPHRSINTKFVYLPIDFEAAKNMNIKYVISNDPIVLNNKLKFIGLFSDPSSPYKLRVYELVY